MNLFALTWSWYEDFNEYLFVHPTKTEEEFRSDCDTLLVKYADEYLQQEDSWAMLPNWISYIVPKLPELGYIPVKPFNASYRGNYIIDENSDQAEIGALIKHVGSEVVTKMIAFNKALREEVHENRIKNGNNLH